MKDTQKWTTSKAFIVTLDCLMCVAILISSMVIVIDRSRMKNGVVYAGKTEPTVTQNEQPDKVNFKGERTARFMCAGDNLIQGSIYRQAAERAGDSGYDFKFAYDGVREIIGKSDLAFINQETLIDPENDPSSYPNYNSPVSLLDELINVGFTVFNQANNHIFDYGVSGAKRDIELFKSKGDKIILTGIYPSSDAMFEPQLTVVNDIIFSFVGFTESVNQEYISASSDIGILSLSDNRSTTDELYSVMKQMITNAKRVSDVVCVSMHWDEADGTEPSTAQLKMAERLLEYGADIIIGTGPQTLQPMEFRKNSDGENALVLWSMGNFISCSENADSLLGGIADITVKKNFDTGAVTIESAQLIPTVTHYDEDFADVRIVPLADYSVADSDKHGIRYISDDFSYEHINEFYTDMFGSSLKIKYK